MPYPDFLKGTADSHDSHARPLEPETRWQRIKKKVLAALLGLLQGIIAGC
jgi:hypothetical protein